MLKQSKLERIAQRAESAGYRPGEHADCDKQRGRTKFEKATLATQDQSLTVYLVWCSKVYDVPFEDCAARFLSEGSLLPKMEELKDFWRFYALQSHGRIRHADGLRTNCPSAKTLKGKAKAWKAGFLRLTGQKLDSDDTEEINRWLQNDLPYETTHGGRRYCINIQRPKYNLQPEDLNQLIYQVWCGKDSKHIHDRNRLQFHFLLLSFCQSGARRHALLGNGVPYKDIQLVLESRQDGPSFFYNLKQRHVKNNKDPDNRCFGSSCIQHPVLRYDSVSILLALAVFDGALDPKDLSRMLENGGSGQVEWNPQCRDLPICRSVSSSGDVHDTKPMTEDTFIDMFKTFFMQAGYRDVPGSIHMIRREVGKQIDKLYTEVERSQHLTQADKAVFGQSYTADISSCDGMSAFLREKPDHRAVDYFQGLTQFRQEGLPTRLPAALKEDVNRDKELLAWDEKMLQLDEKTRKEARQKRQKLVERLEKRKLEEYRRECAAQLTRQNLFKHQDATRPDLHPLHKFRPEIGRLAEKMSRISPASQQDRIDAMRDMQSLLAAPPVFYREHEEPTSGCCPYCSKEMHSITDKRSRCLHIHRCRKRVVANERQVPPNTLKFCYFCNLFFNAEEYSDHCKMHLSEPLKYCGSITYRHTLVRPAFCLLCRQSKRRTPAMRMYFWQRDIDAIRHMEDEHKDEWPWSCPECNFSGDDNKACYHHLHDAHGYELVTEKKQGICRDTGEPTKQSTPSRIDIKPTDSLLSLSPKSKKGEDELTEVGLVNNTLAPSNSHPDNSVMPLSASLDLALTAESSPALSPVYPNDSLEPHDRPLIMENSACDDRYKSVQDIVASPTAMDTNLVRFGPQCDISPQPSPSPLPTLYASDDTAASVTPETLTPGDKKRRINFATAICQPEVRDLESPPAQKKRRIILKIRPRIVSENEHVSADNAATEARVECRDEENEIEKPTKTRIILKTGSYQPLPYRPTTPTKTRLSDPALSRTKWTLEEDDTVCRMKQIGCSWAKIQRALPHRSQGSIQVRYSTKLRRTY